MSYVISFVNTKGGVGKSFLSTSMAVWLFDQGYRVALLDADDQQTSSRWLKGVANQEVDVRTLEERSEEKRADELRIMINKIRKQFDFIAIDTKGAAGLTTSAAVIKSDITVIPLQASAADIWPIENTLSTIRLSQEATGGKPAAFLVLNLTDDSDAGANQVRRLAEQFQIPIAKTNIKRLRAYRDAPGLRVAPTRLNDRRGKKASLRLQMLFQEILSGHLGLNKRIANG